MDVRPVSIILSAFQDCQIKRPIDISGSFKMTVISRISPKIQSRGGRLQYKSRPDTLVSFKPSSCKMPGRKGRKCQTICDDLLSPCQFSDPVCRNAPSFEMGTCP